MRLLSVLAAVSMVVAPVPHAWSQGPAYLEFRAPLVTGAATNAPQVGPLRGAKIDLTIHNPTTNQTTVQTHFTDSNGRVPITAGFVPQVAYVSGPGNLQVRAQRPWTIGSVTTIANWTVVATYPATPSTVTVTTLTSPLGGPLSIAECNAYQHANDAYIALTGLTNTSFATQLDVVIRDYTPFPATPAQFLAGSGNIHDSIEFYAGSSNLELALGARSYSLMAHEYSHRIVSARYFGHSLLPRMSEGLCDFLASVAAGTPIIGAGLTYPGPGGLPRDVSGSATYAGLTGNSHADGLVIAGALYHARQAFIAQNAGTAFDAMIPAFLAAAPFDEPAALCALLHLDDNDANLANGTPHDSLIIHAFTTRHGIPLPPSCGYPTIISVPAGWSHSPATIPTVTGSLTTPGLSLSLNVTTSVPRQGMLLVSGMASSTTAVASGLMIALDPGSILPGVPVATPAAAPLVLTATLPAGLPPFVVEFAFANPASAFGVEASNGLRIQP